MIFSSVSIASILQSGRLFIEPINDARLCWILACQVRGGGGSPRHKPKEDVCPTFEITLPYRVLHRLAVLTDLDFNFMTLDPTLFPNITSDIEVHEGFVIEHLKTANQILAEVERLMAMHSSTNVVLVRLHYSPSGRLTYFPWSHS